MPLRTGLLDRRDWADAGVERAFVEGRVGVCTKDWGVDLLFFLGFRITAVGEDAKATVGEVSESEASESPGTFEGKSGSRRCARRLLSGVLFLARGLLGELVHETAQPRLQVREARFDFFKLFEGFCFLADGFPFFLEKFFFLFK